LEDSQQECERLTTEHSDMQKRLGRNETELERLERDLAKLQTKYKTEVVQVERESEQLKKRLADLEDGFQQRDSRMKNAEIDNDTYQRQLRESEYTIQDLEQKLESNLEQLALLQWELEEYKMHTQEQLERLH
jgi:chromosome segregation ATPase